MLRMRLTRAEIPYTEIDIWEDPDAAAYVRSVANGCETVPTLKIGDIALVNPSLDAVIEAARTAAPSAVAHLTAASAEVTLPG
jgi:glutaredoxin